MSCDLLVERPLLVGQVSKVRVLAGDAFLAPVPAAHGGVESLPTSQSLHLDMSSIAVDSVPALVQEILVVLSS